MYDSEEIFCEPVVKENVILIPNSHLINYENIALSLIEDGSLDNPNESITDVIQLLTSQFGVGFSNEDGYTEYRVKVYQEEEVYMQVGDNKISMSKVEKLVERNLTEWKGYFGQDDDFSLTKIKMTLLAANLLYLSDPDWLSYAIPTFFIGVGLMWSFLQIVKTLQGSGEGTTENIVVKKRKKKKEVSYMYGDVPSSSRSSSPLRSGVSVHEGGEGVHSITQFNRDEMTVSTNRQLDRVLQALAGNINNRFGASVVDETMTSLTAEAAIILKEGGEKAVIGFLDNAAATAAPDGSPRGNINASGIPSEIYELYE